MSGGPEGRGPSETGAVREVGIMLHYALMFLIVGLIAGALGLAGIAAVAGQIAWILFLIGAALIVIHLATGRHPPLT